MKSPPKKDRKKPTPPKRAPRKRGRPAVITLPIVKGISKSIALGLTEEQACVFHRVNHASFRTARSRRPEFESAVKEAHADFLNTALRRIESGECGWQGAGWILERRHGDQFRMKHSIDMTGKVDACGISEEDWERIRKAAREWMERNTKDEDTSSATSPEHPGRDVGRWHGNADR